MPHRLNLQINNRYRMLKRPAAGTRRMFRALEESGAYPISPGDLSIVFVSDRTIGKIHACFLNDPSSTDVITFPADPEMDSAGEIIVSVDHALQRARELGEPFSKELSLYLVHGWLHLAGFKDKTEPERRDMRAAEATALKLLADVIPDYTVD